MKSEWEHFTIEELTCHCGCGRMEMDNEFMQKIVGIRKLINTPLIVSSAYRCPDYNEKVSSTGRNGPHTTGHAIDFKIYGKRAFDLMDIAFEAGMTGIGVKEKGDYNLRFIHLDDLPDATGQPRPTIWSY